MTKDQQTLVNEWHWHDRNDRDESRMARIESRLAASDINPSESEFDKDWKPPKREPIARQIDPEFAKTLSEQDRKNLEAFLGKQ